MKNIRDFLSENFQFLNRHVFVLGCVSWFEYLLIAHVRRYVFSCCVLMCIPYHLNRVIPLPIERLNFIMTFETTYKRKVPYHWLAIPAVIVINPFVPSVP